MEADNAFLYRHTPLEKNYLPGAEVKTLTDKQRIADSLTKQEVPEQQPSHQLEPNQKFIDAYNVRAERAKKAEIRKKSQQLYNEDGQRFGRVWDNEGFKAIHDPLRIFEKKGNYEDLAWKVFNEVEDDNVYLKVLYFPKLTSNDSHLLLDKFETTYQDLCRKKRLSYVMSLGSFLLTWALAYRAKMKFASFLAMSAGAYVATKSGLDFLSHRSMQRVLNTYAGQIAERYPEVKFSKIVYTSSDNITNERLI